MLIDSSAILALYSKEEKYHRQCVTQLEWLAERGEKVVMVDTVLEEIVSLVRKRVGRETACQIARDIIENEMIKIVFMNKELMQKTVSSFLKNKGEYSYVDISEYVYARAFGFKQIIALDSDFSKLGLEVLP